jgi:hypothetical protein
MTSETSVNHGAFVALLLPRLSSEHLPRSASIVKYVIKTFLLHASIVKPLRESGKLQLTSDMTEVEFALNAFTVDASQSHRVGGLESIGSEYKALRAMRYVLTLRFTKREFDV